MSKRWVSNTTRESASKLHKTTFAVLKKQFPLSLIQQEFSIVVIDERGRKNTLFLDFFMPQLRIAIECQGRQHFERVGFFQNSNGDGFKQQQNNDILKQEWCDENNVSLVIIRYDDDVTEEVVLSRIKEVLK